MNKQGIELAVNTLVVIVLGTVILVAGIAMVQRFVSESEDIYEQIDEELREQIRRTQFADGKQVAVLNPYETVKRGKTAYFALGFVNKDNGDGPDNFTVIVEYNEDSPVDDYFSASEWYTNMDGGTDDTNDNFDPDKPTGLILHAFMGSRTEELANNKDYFPNIAFTPPKDIPPGQYYFDVYVCTSDENHKNDGSPCAGNTKELYTGTKQRLFITVI